MLFRFTLNNTIEGAHVITDPDGWKEIKLKLERHKEYHSIVEAIELPLIFYRSSDLVDGGYDYIRQVEVTQGIDALVEILIEVSEDQGTTYETFFEGLLELETIKDISDASFYKMEVNIIRNDFWSKFISRKSQSVNLDATESIDGDSLTQVDNIEIQLPSQKIRVVHRSSSSSGVGYTGVNTGDYFWRAFDTVTVSEIKDMFTIPNSPFAATPDPPVWIVEVKEAGDYTFDLRHECALYTPPSTFAAIGTELNFYIQKNEDAAIALTKTNFATYSEFTYNTTVPLIVGDIIRIYGIFGNDSWEGGGKRLTIFGDTLSSSVFLPSPSGNENPTYFNLTADTIYLSTATDSFLLKDAAESILSKIIGRDSILNSSYLNACALDFAIMNGLHVRGYSMNDKPMFMSFEDWWNGANPIFNMGLGYETNLGVDNIRIEEKSYFYNETPILTFSNVEKITRTYDPDRIYKSIEIGYEKWSAESASGIDDPQTKHTYNTRFKVIGKDERILSKFIAASLAIEQTRRNRVEFGKDWRLDEDILIIALASDSSPYQPVLNDFTGVTGLLNPDTRYNKGLTPARNFERWKAMFNGALQAYLPDTYKFSGGEGNYDMSSTGTGCNSGTIAENQDLDVSADFYTIAEMFEFEYPLSFQDYKTLRDNRNNCIEVSMTTENHVKFFIDEAEYDHYNTRCKFTGWIKDSSDWILETGFWDDGGVWRDFETWND